MAEFPHHYEVTASGAPQGPVAVSSPGLDSLETAPPAQFGGPGDRWSPETLLVGAMADCFVLTFRAIARASKAPWVSLRCEVEGTLDRVERVTRFTGFVVRASLRLPAGADAEQGRRLLERAEHGCLITNSLKGESRLEATVDVEP